MIKKQVSPEDLVDLTKDKIFLGCAIRDADAVYFIARPDTSYDETLEVDRQLPTYVFGIVNSNADYLTFGYVEVDNFERPIMGVSTLPKANVLLFSHDVDGTVLPLGGGQQTWPSEMLHEEGLPSCKRIRRIDDYAWAACGRRMVYQRTEMGTWVNVREGFAPDMSRFGELNNSDCGFEDIDGFSAQDVYAAGGKGDVWHYDGAAWNDCEFSTDDYIYAVCCAADGYVYIGARSALWRGKSKRWEKLCDLPQREEINDMRWFAGKLWIAYDYTLHMWDGERLHTQISYKGECLPLSGSVDAVDDMLVVAGSYQVWTFDGTDWYNVVPKFN
ncbi:hypothetical protein [Culicoidibacter larvae]|uniref:Uncharacterized protein n=1 Tax=Culicoidibacter larvae TaxID=2579976 RepID=A0A5R8QIL1_9FIRM|nr:hypothetical protein [Culicoidibacter larvae]TLG77087.1 hypothetical protein FEZ08_00280 [Culicoidibacter larvae]